MSSRAPMIAGLAAAAGATLVLLAIAGDGVRESALGLAALAAGAALGAAVGPDLAGRLGPGRTTAAATVVWAVAALVVAGVGLSWWGTPVVVAAGLGAGLAAGATVVLLRRSGAALSAPRLRLAGLLVVTGAALAALAGAGIGATGAAAVAAAALAVVSGAAPSACGERLARLDTGLRRT